MKKLFYFFILSFIFQPASALLNGRVSDFSIAFPINCTLNKDCFFFMYPDRYEKTGDYYHAYDYRCNPMSYDGHEGTDIIVKNMHQLNKGIEILAMADGIVYEVRDQIEDRRIREGEPLPTSFEAGNRIYINHADEWHTDYIHLKRGSIRVKKGDKVKKGQVIALMGVSGRAELPHLHFSLYYKDKAVDPFVGLTSIYGCNQKEEPIWDNPYPYKRTGIVNTGFADKVVGLEEIWDGLYLKKELPENTKAIIAWTHMYGLAKGDIVRTIIYKPDGIVFSDINRTIDSDIKLFVTSSGKTTEDKILQTGIWRSEVTIYRGKELIAKASDSFELTKVVEPKPYGKATLLKSSITKLDFICMSFGIDIHRSWILNLT